MGYDEPKLKRLAYLMGKAEEGDAFAAFLLRVELGEVETCEHPDRAYRILVTREEAASVPRDVIIDRDAGGRLWLPTQDREGCERFLWHAIGCNKPNEVIIREVDAGGYYRATGERWGRGAK